MKILVTGATGLVGNVVVASLRESGHSCKGLTRAPRDSQESFLVWNPTALEMDSSPIEGFDAVVHLAGEGIANRRWTVEQKRRIRDSRVLGTKLLCDTIGRLARPPRVLVCASAIGFYGDRGDETLTEDSAPGSGFLPEVCCEWEESTQSATKAGVRVVNLRIGVVLSTQGGALAKMLTPFKLGLGGILGTGRQYMSWIALDDLVGVIEYILGASANASSDESWRKLSGPVNAVAGAVTNYEFTKTLGQVLRRPTVFPMPVFAARLAFGEMADALLLASTRVEPVKLNASGYRFRFPDLAGALRHVISHRS